MTENSKPKNFEEALENLSEIVQKLERGDLPLDEALSSFKKGIELSRFCQNKLNEAEETVAKMVTEQGDILFDE